MFLRDTHTEGPLETVVLGLTSIFRPNLSRSIPLFESGARKRLITLPARARARVLADAALYLKKVERASNELVDHPCDSAAAALSASAR